MTGALPALRRYRDYRKKRAWVRWLEDALLLAVALFAVFTWQTRKLPTGEQVPAFALRDVKGKVWTAADLQGKPALLYLWAPWCPVCKAESGNVARLRSFVGERAHVVSIALAYEDPAEVSAYVKEHGVEYPVLLGDDRLQRALRVDSFPTVLFVSADGRIRRASVAYTSTPGLWLRLFL